EGGREAKGDGGAKKASGEERKKSAHGHRDGAQRLRPGTSCLRAAELEVEAANLQLLEWIGRPLHVPLQAVVLVRLDHGDPGQMLEEELGHPLVRAGAELLVDREARGGAELVELGMAPVILPAS